MKFLRNIYKKARPHFVEGGKLSRFFPFFEAVDTLTFWTDEQTKSGPHIRDSIDLKRTMIIVLIAMIPATIFGIINIGYQQALAMGITQGWSANFLGRISIIFPNNGSWICNRFLLGIAIPNYP